MPRTRFALALRSSIVTSALGASLLLVGGCKPEGEVSTELVEAKVDPLATMDALESKIDSGEVSEAERVFAHDSVRAAPDDGTPGYAPSPGALRSCEAWRRWD